MSASVPTPLSSSYIGGRAAAVTLAAGGRPKGAARRLKRAAFGVASGAVLFIALSGPLSAATRAPSPPLAGATQFYAALTVAERVGIETDLIWTGDYEGVADGDMSASAMAAVRAFQGRNGGKPTGVLNPQEQKTLAAAGRTARQAVGWRLIEDPVTGVRLGVPSKLVGRTAQGASPASFASPHGELQIETFRVDAPGTTLEAVFNQHRKDPSRSVETAVLRPDFFVISGEQGGVKRFSVRAAIKNGEVRGEIIRYDLATRGMLGRLVTAMESAFAAFPTGALVGPDAQREVEYATGVIIDATGRILTDREATRGCLAITIPGLGNADREAEDEDLALLRLYGARALHTVPVAASRAAADGVTLVGVADPALQAGGRAVTAAPARLRAAEAGRNRPLEPSPVAGFSGAAALDPEGRLVGVVTLSPTASGAPQALMVPSDGVRQFLEREHVPLDPGAPRPPADFAAGIVRVICTRS
jgi:peptidoglycan hydrolase-like protein with peptidoglycan-binding domain